MEICVIGTGYVGLVAGTCFAESGNDVTCVDIDQDKIAMLNRGEVPIYEPELSELIERNREENRLTFTTDLAEAVHKSKLIFIAVGTPQDQDGAADLQHVLAVAEQIGRTMNGYKIVIDKSTVPVGTAEKVRNKIRQFTKHPFDVVSNPEFMKEGAAVQDFLKPDRVVIGTDKSDVADLMSELYAPFVRTENPIMIMDIPSAEMTKYASNALLATKISFINEIANLCEKVGADISNVRKGVGADRRIGYQFIFPGTGYGGSCFPKDVKALIRMGDENSYLMRVVKAVDDVNEAQKAILLRMVHDHFGPNLKDLTFGIWGLSFKPQTDDMREAPAITIINGLLEAGAKVKAHDPAAMNVARQIFEDKIEFVDMNYDAIADADALIVVTEWNEFRRPNFERMKQIMKRPIIFDGRNLYTPAKMKELNFTYYCIGRPKV